MIMTWHVAKSLNQYLVSVNVLISLNQLSSTTSQLNITFLR